MSSKSPIVILRTTEAYQEAHRLKVEPGKSFDLSHLVATDVKPEDVLAPTFAVGKMVRLQNGDYRLVPVEWDDWVPLNDRMMKKLGLNFSRLTLLRLAANEYVKIRRTSPQVTEINLPSLVRHLKAVADDPKFWKRPAEDGTHRSRAEAFVPHIY